MAHQGAWENALFFGIIYTPQWGYIGDYVGVIQRIIAGFTKGDTWSLDVQGEDIWQLLKIPVPNVAIR